MGRHAIGQFRNIVAPTPTVLRAVNDEPLIPNSERTTQFITVRVSWEFATNTHERGRGRDFSELADRALAIFNACFRPIPKYRRPDPLSLPPPYRGEPPTINQR